MEKENELGQSDEGKDFDSAEYFRKMELKEARKGGYRAGLFTGLAVTCAAFIVFCLLGTIQVRFRPTDKDSVMTEKVANKVRLLENSINQYFLNDFDKQTLETGIYKGMVENLGDPYSTYYSVEELTKVQESTEGVYYGIGAYIQVDKETEGGRITKVMAGSPAEEAGVKDNDIIVKVDGESVLGMALSDIVGKIKGPENTEVLLTLYREGAADYIELPVTRRKIESPTVNYEMLDHQIAYIQITEFDSVTTDQFVSALNQAREEGMEKLILDLRDNPGGNLSDVIAISKQILPKGLIVYTEDKNGKRVEYSCDGTHELDVPMVVLVNGYSASASEILSGAIKDYGKGTILGTTTYGKGIVQRIFSMTDGSAIKLTVSHYYTPKGNDIHKVGIEPDETLEFDSQAYLDNGIDNQLERAKEILGGK